MSVPSPVDEKRLSVVLDVRHPLAYLALHPTLELAKEIGIEIDWLPLAVQPLHPPSRPGPQDDRGVRHRRARAEAIAREIETYARSQGLEMRDYYRTGDAAALNLAWLYVRDRHPDRFEAFLVEAFRAYWAAELDPASGAEVASLLDSIGAQGAAYRAWSAGEGGAAAASVAEALRARGLSAVPCYLVEDEVFLGRQHLPMIRWILEGRGGPGPI